MLRLLFSRDAQSDIEITARGLELRPGTASDAEAWVTLRESSKEHLTRWEPDWNSAEVTAERVRARLRMQARARDHHRQLGLFVFQQSDGALVGGVNLTNIRHGAACSAQIGYWIGAPFVGKGLGTIAVGAALDYAFDMLGLNRIEAACQPENTASRRLLERLGFKQEGLARQYLFINGGWRDHVIYALLTRDRRMPSESPAILEG